MHLGVRCGWSSTTETTSYSHTWMLAYLQFVDKHNVATPKYLLFKMTPCFFFLYQFHSFLKPSSWDLEVIALWFEAIFRYLPPVLYARQTSSGILSLNFQRILKSAFVFFLSSFFFSNFILSFAICTFVILKRPIWYFPLRSCAFFSLHRYYLQSLYLSL